jgi:nucleoid-associated protein YgaU
MPSVVVSIVAASAQLGHRHAVIKCGGDRIVLPITSPNVDHGGLAGDWKTVVRPLDKPLIGMAGLQLATDKVTCTIQADDGSSVESTLKRLVRFAQDADHHVSIANFGSFAAGPWHITDLDIASDRRRFGTNRITRAQVTMTLTESTPDPDPKATKPKATKWGRRSVWGSATMVRTYIVKAGDTLPSIAVKFYGHADDWHSIALANSITNSRSIKVGQKLLLP